MDFSNVHGSPPILQVTYPFDSTQADQNSNEAYGSFLDRLGPPSEVPSCMRVEVGFAIDLFPIHYRHFFFFECTITEPPFCLRGTRFPSAFQVPFLVTFLL